MITPRGTFSEKEVARHYDELDRFYLEVWGEHVHHGLWVSGRETVQTAVRQLVDLVAVEANIRPDESVCDVGAGYGAAARHVASSYGARVTALTLSPAQHEYALQAASRQNNPTYVLGDWLANEMPDSVFDAVYAIECVSHMSDPAQFAHECARVLKPGGRLVICAWVAAEQVSPWQADHLLEPICREGRLAHLSTAREYLNLLEDAGLSTQNFRDLSRKVRRTWPIVIRRTLLKIATRPRYLQYLLRSDSSNRSFLLSTARLWLAYRTGSIRYLLLKAVKPQPMRGGRPAILT